MRMDGTANVLLNALRERFYYPDTGLVYDYSPGTPGRFPPTEQIHAAIPDPCGYGTGMEDCMLSGGTLLDALVFLAERGGAAEIRGFASGIAGGMLRCAEAGRDGFLPRGLSPEDGASHYPDSSRDQYTLFVYGLWRYARSELCGGNEKERIRAAFERIADRAERNVTPETGFDLLREDGLPSRFTQMWGGALGNHEVFRLPMIHLAAWDLSRRPARWETYLRYRDEALRRSLPVPACGRLYGLQQMACSLIPVLSLDPEGRDRAEEILREIAAVARDMVPVLDEEIACLPPEAFRIRGHYADFYRVQDAAIVPMLESMAPGVPVSPESASLFRRTLARMDLQTHESALPAHFLNAYLRCEET